MKNDKKTKGILIHKILELKKRGKTIYRTKILSFLSKRTTNIMKIKIRSSLASEAEAG